MPINTFSEISLSSIFQELPSLVSSHGLFVEVFGYGTSSTPGCVGNISLKVITYTNDAGRLKESRLLRKMMQLPACVLPCTFCTSTSNLILEPEQCPICLVVSKNPSWKKETSVARVTVAECGTLTVEAPFDDHVLKEFLQPLFTKQVQIFERDEKDIIRASEEFEKKKMEIRKRRFAIDQTERDPWQ